MQELIEQLSARRSGLEVFDPVWQMIDDVINENVKVKAADGWKSPYIPKGHLEPASEYALRIEITPFFPQTPTIMASRIGALFKNELNYSNESGMEEFIAAAGRRHASFEDVATSAASLCQAHGYCAAVLDRESLPADTAGRDISEAEAKARALARPYIALYPAPHILDWEYAADGRLEWVKFGEDVCSREAWNEDEKHEIVYRIVGREFVEVFHVSKDDNGEWKVVIDTPKPHGFNDRVPVVFVHPFPGDDGIGRPILRRIAESDISATRVLSDLVWDLFLLGNPILTFKTDRAEEEMQRLALGASRYIPLKNGRPGFENPEELEFVKLDPAGIELLFKAHTLFVAQGQPTAMETGPEQSAGTAIPQMESGIAKSYRFKTGEERILFLLAHALEPFLNECLELAGIALGLTSFATVAFPENFDNADSAPAQKGK